MQRPLIVAHRGASAEAPENTLAAFQKAIDIGADLIELDVHLTADNIPVVIHDNTLSRTTNENRPLFVSDLTLEELKKLDAGSWFNKDFTNEAIPTLLEVLRLERGATGLVIELKATNKADHDLPLAVLKILEENASNQRDLGQIHLASFSSRALKEIQKHTSFYPLYGIASDEKTVIRHLELGLRHLFLAQDIATQKKLSEYHQRGISVIAWTVDDPQKMQELIQNGIDGIITNNPRSLTSIVQHLCPNAY